MFSDWFLLIAGTVGALLPIANPFSTAPVFAAITSRMTTGRRNQQARMAAIYTVSILVGALLVGSLIMSFFGISLPALRIAGGLVVARVGFSMLNPDPQTDLPEDSRREAMDMRDIAFTPIALPLLSGPGSIAVTISMATTADNVLEYLAITIGIAVVAFLSWLILRSSTQVVDFMGATGMDALTRLMGFLLVCIGIQFVAYGIFQALTLDNVVEALQQAYGLTARP